jgi:hypothetical protein
MNNKKITFLIKPDIINDIYYLYYRDKNEYIKYDIACIPNIKTSIQMNLNSVNNLNGQIAFLRLTGSTSDDNGLYWL